MAITRQQLANWFTYVVVFLLPWQTQWIYQMITLNEGAWEYGVMGLYATEVLIVLAVLLRGRAQWLLGSQNVYRASLIFIGVCVIGMSTTWFFGGSLAQLLHVIMTFALFSLLVDHRVKTKSIIWAFLGGLIVPITLGWWQVITGGSPASTVLGLAAKDAAELGVSVVETDGVRLLRSHGSFPHPNIFGGYLATALVLLGWLTWKDGQDRLWWVYLLMTAICSSGLIITFSRSAWLALFFAIAVISGFALWFKFKPNKKALLTGLLAIIMITMTATAFSSAMCTRFNPDARLEATSIEERVGGYEEFGDIFMQNPLMGVGLRSYTVAQAAQAPEREPWQHQPIHNTFLLILAELGILGFLAFIYWFNTIDWINYRVARSLNGIFAMGLGTVLLVVALFDHYPWSFWSGLALMGFAFALMLRWSLEATKKPTHVQSRSDS